MPADLGTSLTIKSSGTPLRISAMDGARFWDIWIISDDSLERVDGIGDEERLELRHGGSLKKNVSVYIIRCFGNV